jgi:hypothetical protein
VFIIVDHPDLQRTVGQGRRGGERHLAAEGVPEHDVRRDAARRHRGQDVLREAGDRLAVRPGTRAAMVRQVDQPARVLRARVGQRPGHALPVAAATVDAVQHHDVAGGLVGGGNPGDGQWGGRGDGGHRDHVT